MTVLDTGLPVYHRRSIPKVTPRSPGNARRWAQQALPAAPDDLLRAISELVTNVLRYATGPALVRLRQIDDDAIEVAVADRRTDGIPPELAPADDGEEHGWGLFILNAQSLTGVQVQPWPGRGLGKQVVVTLPYDPKNAEEGRRP